jgi:hypothetical protein
MMRAAALRFSTIALLLGVCAAVAHAPSSSDSDMYQAIGRHLVVLDCHDVHCFRVLVAGVLEHLPGPSLLKWKAYAVIAIAAAALAMGRLCLVLGLPARAAGLAVWVAAFGFGPMQSIFDPYTSDPAMYLLGPLMMADLLTDRLGRAVLLGSVGVLAKEFAAAPLWIVALAAGLQRRWEAAARVLIAAIAVSLVWLVLQTVLMTLYNYSYGGNPSANLTGGGFIAVWVAALGWRLAAFYLFMSFGPLYLLAAAGIRRASAPLRLIALASIPAVVAFMYVQQPDRALANFQFVIIPLAMLVLQELPDRLYWAFVVCFGAANLRLGDAQPAWYVWVRLVGLAGAMALSLHAVVIAFKRDRLDETSAGLA